MSELLGDDTWHWMFDHGRDRLYAALTPTDLLVGRDRDVQACASLGARDAAQAQAAGTAWTCLGVALATDAVPDPVAAAFAGRLALTVMDTSPGEVVLDQVDVLHRTLAGTWPGLAETTDLGEKLEMVRTLASF